MLVEESLGDDAPLEVEGAGAALPELWSDGVVLDDEPELLGDADDDEPELAPSWLFERSFFFMSRFAGLSLSVLAPAVSVLAHG